MARLVLTGAQATVHEAVGTAAFLAGRARLAAGDLVDARCDASAGQVSARIRGGGEVTAVLAGSGGLVSAVDGGCSCGQHPECGHVVAAALLAVEDGALVRQDRGTTRVTGRRQRAADRVGPAAWEAAIGALVAAVTVPSPPAVPDDAAIGLQFDVVAQANEVPGAAAWRVALRPVVPGRSGWVRTGISWSTLPYSQYRLPRSARHHVRLLTEIQTLAGTEERYHYSGSQSVYLDQFASRRIWDLLAEAHQRGLPMVQAGRGGYPVFAEPDPVTTSVLVAGDGTDLVVRPALRAADGSVLPVGRYQLVGQPAHGVIWWGEPGQPGSGAALHVAATATAVEAGLAAVLAAAPVRVPADERQRFFDRFYPSLARRIPTVPDGGVTLPELPPETLLLDLSHRAGPVLELAWDWSSSDSEPAAVEGLWQPVPLARQRERSTVLSAVTGLAESRLPALLEDGPAGRRLAARTVLSGDEVVVFAQTILPELATLGVQPRGQRGHRMPDYQEVVGVPELCFVDGGEDSGGAADGAVDWYDLAVRVSVGGQRIAFAELFTALAQRRRYLVLPDGRYLALDRPEFVRLTELIAESRDLNDAPPGVLRVGRLQTSVWQEVADLGELTGPATAWSAAVRQLAAGGGSDADLPAPIGLKAELRAYQLDGYRWLAARYRYGLGGVLADDMGLGKTVQTLAWICQARQDLGSGAPFLVVAPASVVHNWLAEAARFAPDLTVRVVGQTGGRRGVSLASLAGGADVVVTSYALFRLEYDEYAALEWRALVLDEAQAVKNPAAVGYRCARSLPVPVKFAITGTPLENNLAELWALLSITAPGLFPRADRFAEYYRTPIERNRDGDRLDQLRRRIRPVLLRRRKTEVAADLPDKQEQVLELELNPRHRRVYQTLLARERQKVLGLLGDVHRNRFEIFRSLTLLRQAALDVSLVDPAHQKIPSTKLDVLVEQVGNVIAEGHRVLVFSQFTRFLSAARRRLSAEGVELCYLDGRTRDRAAALSRFKNGTAPVFLISLKAGGFGLNLTEADFCILLDPWWNPATEAQAVDRTHRIGQTRPVMVYRMVSRDTIEEKVMALKARKAKLFSSLLDGGDFASAGLTAADIRALLS